MSFFYRIITSCFKGYFQVFHHLKVYGLPINCPGKAIIAPNHTSFLDPPLIGGVWPNDLHFLARASLFHQPIGAWILSKLNAHPVQGSTHNIEVFRLVCELLEKNEKVVIFPEGERSSTGQIQSLKSGVAMLALRMQCPIIPVYISGTFDAWPRHSRWPKLRTPITCVFGTPLFPSFISGANKKQMQEELSQKLQEKLEQLRLWLETGAKGTPP